MGVAPEILRFLKEGVQLLPERPLSRIAVERMAAAGDIINRTRTARFPVRIKPRLVRGGGMTDQDLMRVHFNETIDPERVLRAGMFDDPPIEQTDIDFMSSRAEARAMMGRGNHSAFDEIDTDPAEKFRILRRIPAIVDAHIRHTRPDSIAWTGTSSSRDKLYDSLARRMAEPDYKRPGMHSHVNLERVTPRGSAGPGYGVPVQPKDAWKLPILAALLGVSGGALGAVGADQEMI